MDRNIQFLGMMKCWTGTKETFKFQPGDKNVGIGERNEGKVIDILEANLCGENLDSGRNSLLIL